ncbi:MAG: hypothetical protein ABIB43_04575 [archaeon]
MTKQFKRLGFIGRFKPLHLGASAVLEGLCKEADEVIIGIGSSNKYNLRNPFTAEETEDMIDAYLSPNHSNYSIVRIPDYAHIPKFNNGNVWTEHVLKEFGSLDAFVTGNEYVNKLLEPHYKIIHSAEFVPFEKRTRLRASAVRVEMARNGPWQSMVPEEVKEYLQNNSLIKRFKKEFGLETISKLVTDNYFMDETKDKEKIHTMEV